MKEIEYVIYLTAESADRLRVYAQKEKSIILEFVVGTIRSNNSREMATNSEI